MSFWSSQKMRSRLNGLVDPAEPSRVKQGAYEMSLGGEAYVSGSSRKEYLLHRNGPIVTIQPGRVALLLMEERVRIPVDAVGFISLKSTAKFPGMINVSGFHVDPGYDGHLVFTVYNAGTERVTYQRGDPLFLLWVAEMDGGDDPYPKPGLERLSSDLVGKLRRPGASPADLDARIRRLEWVVYVGGFTIVTTTIAAVIANLLTK